MLPLFIAANRQIVHWASGLGIVTGFQPRHPSLPSESPYYEHHQNQANDDGNCNERNDERGNSRIFTVHLSDRRSYRNRRDCRGSRYRSRFGCSRGLRRNGRRCRGRFRCGRCRRELRYRGRFGCWRGLSPQRALLSRFALEVLA